MDRRISMFALITALSAIVLSPTTTLAQTYPNRPIKLIVPFATGGATDLYARTLGAALSVELGQQIVVEARPGAGGLTRSFRSIFVTSALPGSRRFPRFRS